MVMSLIRYLKAYVHTVAQSVLVIPSVLCHT